MDARTGRLLYQKNAREKRAIASTTKILTAIIVIERSRPGDIVKTSKRAAAAGQSELYLSVDETRTVEELLYGLLLRSANDAAVALAEHVAGSQEDFARLMNEKARQLGARDSNFTNPHGLANGAHYSTALDLAEIARYAMRNPVFAKIVATKERTIPWPASRHPRLARNRNRLLWSYPFATGIKTGYVRQSGYCVVASASKAGVNLISVVLGAPNDRAVFDDAKKLLDYGFSLYADAELVRAGERLGRRRLSYGQELTFAAERALRAMIRREPGVRRSIRLRAGIRTPLSQGEKVGTVVFYQDGLRLGVSSLVAEHDVAAPGMIQKAGYYLGELWGRLAGLWTGS